MRVLSMRLRGFWIVVLFVGISSFWLNGKGMRTMTTLGYKSKTWVMPQRQFMMFIVRCLGRLEPEGGVMLGILLGLEIIYVILYLFKYIIYIYIYIYIMFIL